MAAEARGIYLGGSALLKQKDGEKQVLGGWLACLDVEEKRIRWARKEGEEMKGLVTTLLPLPGKGIVAGGTVPGKGGWLGLYAADDGKAIWERGSADLAGLPGHLKITEKGILAGGSVPDGRSGWLGLFDPATGQEIWPRPKQRLMGFPHFVEPLADDTFLVGVHGAVGSTIGLWSPAEGFSWMLPTKKPGDACLDPFGTRFFCHEQDGGFGVRDARTGEPLWRRGPANTPGPMAGAAFVPEGVCVWGGALEGDGWIGVYRQKNAWDGLE